MASTERMYDLSLFESSAVPASPKKNPSARPNKKGEIIKLPKEKLEKIQRRHHNPVKLFVGFFCAIIITAVVGSIVQGQAQLTEINAKIDSAQKVLSDDQSLYTQTKMKLESKYSTSVIEKYASDKLGMSQAQNYQKEFISLSHGDKAEVVDKKPDGFFETLKKAIDSFWS
ncbi:MAG: hypothetical protein Q8876_00030 [Bacillota bacterium]|nr:hypothetical protein [Bacillota bacterium]